MSSFFAVSYSQAMKCGFTKLMSWKEVTLRDSPASASLQMYSKLTLPLTSERTGRLTCLLESNFGGEMKKKVYAMICRTETIADPPNFCS